MIATSNPIGRDDTVMVDTKDIDRILDKLNKEVIPGISKLRTEIEVIKVRQEEITKSHDKEDTQRVDMIKTHDRALRGYNGYPGLVSEMKDVKDWIAARVWFERLILSAVILESIGIIFLLVKLAFGL